MSDVDNCSFIVVVVVVDFVLGLFDRNIFEQIFRTFFHVVDFCQGRGGRGVASSRVASGWSAPAFFTLGGGSIGPQIGAQSTDLVMLFMNNGGLQSLLTDEFTLGGDASVAAGPVGRQAGAATDVKLDAQILSYSRSRGLFAGLELAGVVIKPDVDDMRDIYGAGVSAKSVLQDAARSTPMSVQAFPAALGRYSTR